MHAIRTSPDSVRSISMLSEWVGLGPCAAEAFKIEKRQRQFYLSRSDGSAATPVAAESIGKLLAALANPVLSGDSPKFFMTCHCPTFRLRLLFEDEEVVVADSDSQGPTMAPWNCWIGGAGESFESHSRELGPAIAGLLPEGALNRAAMLPPDKEVAKYFWALFEQVSDERPPARVVRPGANELDEALFHIGWADDPVAELHALLGRGANVNAQDHSGRTPLAIAVKYRKYALVKPLLEAGADPELADEYGCTPLVVACDEVKSAEQIDAASELMAAGANAQPCLRVVLASSSSPLDEIIRQMILSECQNIDERDGEGHTGLMHAAIYGRGEEVRRWVEAGASIDAWSPRGETALMFGLLTEEIVDSLIEAGANVNAADRKGETVLHKAVRNIYTSVEVVRALLAAGADPRVRDRDGRSVVDLLSEREKGLELELVVRKEFGCESRGYVAIDRFRDIRELIHSAARTDE